ncbi:MAG: hypothetical protein KAS67_03695 [Thermoplasmata archaeon]|nr:hypothetical protein [Thermoplasmata archaeon]
MQKKKSSEQDNAEQKYSGLIEKRNELNTQAREYAEARNALNTERRRILDECGEMREERRKLVDQMRVHKKRRNAYQAKGKALIEKKRKAKGKLPPGLDKEIETTRAEVRYMDIKQQTVPMTVQEENILLDEIKHKMRKMEELEVVKEEEDKVLEDVKKADLSITELFELADEEHEKVVVLSKQINVVHDKITAATKSIPHLIAEANKNHEAYVSIKEKADAIHEKAQEMRRKLMAMRNEKREEAREGRKMVSDHNKGVKKELADEKSLDKAADDALQKLLKKGKVEI